MAERKDTDNRPESAEWVITQHTFAKGLFREANARADQCVRLLTEGVPVPRDRADAGNVEVTQPVLAGAIVERLRQMLQVESNLRLRSIPQDDSEREAERCTKRERWVDGYWRQTMYHMRRNPHRDLTWWGLATGRGYYEARLRPDWAGRGRVPIETICDDPRTIYPVKGRGHEILWYTKEYPMYGRQLQALALQLQARDEPLLESGSIAQLEANRLYPVVEYWDGEYYACVLDRNYLLMSNRHEYGFVPLAEWQCLDTPLAAAEWAAQSVIGPVVEHIKQMYVLAAKMATGVNLFFYPLLYGVSATGEPIIIDPNNPGKIQQQLAPGTKLEVINIQVNAPMLAQLMAFFRGDINLRTIPETAWGTEPQTLQSGFAYAQVLNQVQSAVLDKTPSLGRCIADHFGNVLRLVEQVAEASDVDLAVPVDYDE